MAYVTTILMSSYTTINASEPTTHHEAFPPDARSAAVIYIQRGLAPIPLLPRSKDPGYDGWQDLRLTLEDIDRHFPAGQSKNLGILNGSPSHNTLDVDLDCEEARLAAHHLLPATGWIFGRESTPRAHWIYQAECSPDAAQEVYRDPDGTMLIELRSSRGMTVFPPSRHEDTGEAISWDQFTDPGRVSLADLQRAVREIAAAALIARYWPDIGCRHHLALAIAGGLSKAGWELERIKTFAHAVFVAAKTGDIKNKLQGVASTHKKAAEGRKVTGWPHVIQFLKGPGNKIVTLVREWLGISTPARVADVREVPQTLPWPDAPAEEAFHGLAGRIVRTIEPSTEADSAALLVQMLVVFGNAVGRRGHFCVEASHHFPNEFAVLVGRTSKARKGTSWERVVRLLEQADAQWFTERVVSGVSSGEGIIWAVRDPIQKRDRIREKGEVRYQDVEADPGVADKRLQIYEPEFANVLKQTERQGNTASVVLRQAWDGSKVLRTLTKNAPACATGAHVSFVGHITSDELRRYLTQTETANGFGNRFLYVCADRSKLLPEGGHVDVAAWHALQSELVEAIEFAKSAGEVRRDDEARSLWCQVYGELSDGKPGLAGSLLARAEAHVMRLALLYALLDRSSLIQAPHLMAAVALWDYCERSVRFVFGDSLGDPVADELLRLLRSCPNGLTRTDIRDYFQRNASADRIGRALGLLLQHKLARRDREQTGGKPAERWFAVRAQQG
jgi:hypothetical protein